MIFCLGEGRYERQGNGYHKLYCAWNKDVIGKRYDEILKEVREILSDFKLDAREDWTKEWQKVRESQWEKLSKIPEFDLEITKQITGLSKIPEQSDAKNKAKKLRDKADELLKQATDLEESL
jgi:hypothetical protein